ncbi:hypothetical protein P7C70_g2274, partial [Phenoliferia sp. Uapishka_3]
MLIAQDEGNSFFHEIYLTDRSPSPYWTPTTLLNTIDLTIRLVRLLASIHNLYIVHGSLRPTTLSVSVFGEPHIHDFSCAFRTTGADATGSATGTAPIRERGMSEESLPYLAPECSGRIGRGADYRSDYYSLGASLFHVFTGQVPFAEATDPLDIIHAHIAKRPPLASDLDESIPIPLASVIAKLLEKAPDARYQTSQGLIVDLETIAALVRTKSRGPSHLGPVDDAAFVVGSVDEAAHFRLPPSTKLFGRDESVEQLFACYRRVETLHTSEVVIVKGLSGIGKTSLVETVRKPVINARGFFTSVKFDQIKSPVPFFAISQALSGLLRQLLSESEPQLVVWRRRLSKVLAREGRVLAEVLPALENVFEIGWLENLPPIISLGPAESERRFQDLVQKVLRVFARGGRPLVIMFDDLQWSTASDLVFIISLLGTSADLVRSSSPLLILCVYRDNEVNADHIVNTILLPQLPNISLSIKLEPLKLKDVMGFVSESLRKPAVVNKPGDTPPRREDPSLRGLSELILQKTLGSPLFVAQLLKTLNNEGFFQFDFGSSVWRYDLDLIASKSLSTDVVELLRAQMLGFSPQCQEILKVASSLGNEETRLETLANAAGVTIHDVVNSLHEAVEAGLLVPVGHLEGNSESEEEDEDTPMTLVNSSQSTLPAFYRFFHDRVQQAAYTLVPPSERSQLHYRIGHNLVSATPEDAINEHIFNLANQLNHGIDILHTQDERDALARYNYIAGDFLPVSCSTVGKAYLKLIIGHKANKATAFEAARKYLGISWDLLGPGGWIGQHKLMCLVAEELVEVEFSVADYAASQEYVSLFLENAKDIVSKLRIYSRSLKCATATGDSTRAITIGREGLAMIGIRLPSETEDAQQLATQIRAEIDFSKLIYALENAPHLTDPIAKGAQAILAALVPPIYFTRIDLLGALSSLSVRSAYQNGIDDSGAMMLTLHAVMVSGQYKEFDHSYALGRIAVGYFQRFGGTSLACPTYKVYASHVAVWSEPIRETLPSFKEAVAFGIEYRDGEYLGFGAGELCSEQARSLGATQDAITLYDLAIAEATVSEFTHLAACMNERCASLLPSPKLAVGYVLAAYQDWKTWGCVPKVNDMVAQFPHLFGAFRPPLPETASSTGSRSGLANTLTPTSDPTKEDVAAEVDEMEHSTSTREESSNHTSWLHMPRRSSPGSHMSEGLTSNGEAKTNGGTPEAPLRSHLATELDLRTVVSASSVIGMETSVDGVVSKLLGLALRTAGAELVLLVLYKNQVLCAEAIARSDSTEVVHLHRVDSIDVQPERYPCSVINYVARSRTMVVNDLDALGDAISDPYLTKHRPKSILCMALASQSRVIGVLYMENSQTTKAFTAQRLEILSLISGQAATTVEKARLVQDLKSANSELTRSQASLETYNRNLEGTVNARTIELRDQNTRLAAEIFEKERAQAEMRVAKEVAESATAMKSQFLENVQLRSALESSMDMVAERAASKSVELALVFEQGDIACVTDLTRLRQIIVNLLSNAVKFTSDGEVLVTCTGEPAGVSETGEPLSRVIISVSDKESQRKTFQNFSGDFKLQMKDAFTAHSSSSRVFSQVDGTTQLFGGTGLGLAISRKLSNLMGGDIDVTSELGKGSTFTLAFVAPTGKAPETDPYSPSQNPDLSRKRVLIIDSHVATRGVIQHLILSFGMEACAPSDTNQAFAVGTDAADSGKPFDLLILDSFLPNFAAQTLLRRLRQRGLQIPAIALTRMGSPAHDALRQFTDTFLIKPIKRNRLHHTLRQIFPSGESRRPLSPNESSSSASPFPTNLAVRNPLVLLCAEPSPLQPRLNGLEATRKICELMPDKANRPHIVAMTANAMAGDRDMCFKAGCDGYVSKPILVPDLISALHDAYAKVRDVSSLSTDSGLKIFELELPARRGSRKSAYSTSTTVSPARSPVLSAQTPTTPSIESL